MIYSFLLTFEQIIKDKIMSIFKLKNCPEVSKSFVKNVNKNLGKDVQIDLKELTLIIRAVFFTIKEDYLGQIISFKIKNFGTFKIKPTRKLVKGEKQDFLNYKLMMSKLFKDEKLQNYREAIKEE